MLSIVTGAKVETLEVMTGVNALLSTVVCTDCELKKFPSSQGGCRAGVAVGYVQFGICLVRVKRVVQPDEL